MDGRPTWTDCDEAGDYVVPNVLSPRDLVFRPDNMDETRIETDLTFTPDKKSCLTRKPIGSEFEQKYLWNDLGHV